jgi:hypothetical protein
MTHWLPELWQWLASLDASFAFLLALPFLIALTGLASLFFEKQSKDTRENSG